MFCPKCGKKNDDKAMFCEQCGEKINENNQNTKVKNNSRTILIICGVCFIGIIFVCLFMFFKDKNDFQFSELRYVKSDTDLIYIKGKVKNNTNKTCNILSVEYKYESSNFSDIGYMDIKNVSKKDTKDIFDLTFDVDEYDYKEYKISVIEAECK